MFRQWNFLKIGLAIVVGMTGFSQLQASGVAKEEINFLREDGRSYINYTSLRSREPAYSVWFAKNTNLDRYLYINPNKYQWDTRSSRRFNVLKFLNGSYALMNFGTLKSNLLTVTRNGTYRYTNWDRRTKSRNGHYGVWNAPHNFKQLAISWVMPANFEIVSYRANRPGKWVKRGNTISFFAQNVNDVVYTIEYRPRGYATYRAFRKVFGSGGQVGVMLDGRGVRLLLSETILFPSGEARLSTGGKRVLESILHVLRNYNRNRIIVEGHTDDHPIRGRLKQKFKNNWSLSSARSLAVLNFILDTGVRGERLESRAYGRHRPIAENSTPEGRARNRRIELILEAQNPRRSHLHRRYRHRPGPVRHSVPGPDSQRHRSTRNNRGTNPIRQKDMVHTPVNP
ncbi:Flagellar motor rotation protein MotB [hydrothermal vent metagenome]|uniref:Flagellar motor rotation protein MotB n=1 Tax=hydrothermal vent metagenome TaxID=652676 RepID=A0A3B0ZEK5_9ZZZZ